MRRERLNRICTALTLLTLAFAMLPGCSVVFKRSSAGPDTRFGLLRDGGFEGTGVWYRTAPPGYARYATIDIREGGRRGRSAYVALHRHPRASGAVLHGFAQEIEPVPKGRRLRLSGWVRLSGNPTVHFGLDYELAQPVQGRTVVSVEAPPPPADGRFHLVQHIVELPENAVKVVCYVGISTLGEAWFDDVALVPIR